VDPLSGTGLLIVDGSNFLPALSRTRAIVPPAALVGRIRAAIPAFVAIELFFDGRPEPGMRRARVASGVEVRYAAPVTADGAIEARIERLEPATRRAALLVTDDAELRRSAERLGARTARSHWLLARLERGVLAAPAAGNRRRPLGR
jgi:hypothetical protein